MKRMLHGYTYEVLSKSNYNYEISPKEGGGEEE